jgi:hypothetical protein
VGAAAVVFEPAQRRQAQPGVDLAGELADRPGLAPVGVQVEQLQPRGGGVLGHERAAKQLVAGAHGEDHRATGDGAVQPAVGYEAVRGEGLRTVLAAAEEIDVGRAGEGVVGTDLGGLHVEAAQPGSAGEHQQVAPVAVRRQQVGVDPHDAQRAGRPERYRRGLGGLS